MWAEQPVSRPVKDDVEEHLAKLLTRFMRSHRLSRQPSDRGVLRSAVESLILSSCVPVGIGGYAPLGAPKMCNGSRSSCE
jgi:hypothetical protein